MATAASTLNVPLPPLKDDRWELYHVAEDFSEANDLAAQNPAKLKELQDLFMKEAESVLRKISTFNDGVQARLFDPNRLAQSYPESRITRPFRFNA